VSEIIENLYKRIIKFCKQKKAKWMLYFVSFFESIIFPLPTDPFMIPFIIAENKFVKLTLFVTLFSVLGGIFSYFIGSFLWEYFYPFINLRYPNIYNLIDEFETKFTELGVLLIIIGGFSPFPYKITCIASGILGINFLAFVIASFFSRGFRFLLVAYLIYAYGEKSIIYIKKNIYIVSIILIILLSVYMII
jgi:membrane protein YqaA with SNARE-associated domain